MYFSFPKKGTLILATALALGLGSVASTASASTDKGTIDVLNWWTSGSEAESMKVLQKDLAKQGYKMINDAVAGGGGSNALTVLKSRIQSGNIPGAAQIKGVAIQQWCQTGLTGNIDDVAKKQDWNKILPENVAKGMQCDGHYVAIPLNVHRVDWLWINRKALEKANATMPTDWDSLVAALKKVKAAGITPIAGGGDTWQTATEFDAIALATGGADFYRKAFIELDPEALGGATMAKAFARLRTIQSFEDPNGKGLAWNHNSSEIVSGKAAMQIMGDWAKGEFINDGATPGKDIACMPFPGEHTGYVYNVDSFVVFANSKSDKNAQDAFAHTALTPDFQRTFNKDKGSIPVRTGVSLKGFDVCAKDSSKALQAAQKNNTAVPSFSQSMAETSDVEGAISDVIARFTTHKNMSPEEAAKQMATAVKQAKMLSGL